ncbi:hypothetical protein JNB91_23160 [Rhizobium wenxiniae]|uniref:hypothetical protein n=1 Tax=Rhizobium wenxiniae TaxID=1737357 RepID=UPI001C6F371B|nr:hypothetical protein [Rhizobium wenxiniae]MBW9090720.1 hypothetical protein [Rhizobium wenxiniae]
MGHLLFVCVAIGLTWAGFVSMFAYRPDMTKSHLVQVTAATSIFLGSLGLALTTHGLLMGALLAAGGITIAAFVGRRLSLPWSLAFAACSFAAYLHVAGNGP